MSTRVPMYGRFLLFLALVTAAACERANGSITAPSGLTVSSLQSFFAAEPLTIRPELLHSALCGSRPPFSGRVSIIVQGGPGVILREVQFNFTDRLGRSALPEVTPIFGVSAPAIPASTIPTASPIPFPGNPVLPGASPIPIPGSSPVHGIFIQAGSSRTLPFDLRFGCGVVPDGTLLIRADAADRSGRFDTAVLRVRIGS